MTVAILGGGISGLTLAWQLQKAGVAYDLFEAEATPGGCLRSVQHPAGYLLETGPNSLQLSDELLALLTELDLTDEIEDAAAVSKHRYVLRDGRYQELPGSPPSLLTNGFFSLKGKLNILGELLRPAAPVDPQETVAAFFRRRFGSEIVDYAVNPFISGIYAGDPEQLLVHKTFSKVAALEQQYGSVLRGLAKSGGGAGRRRIITLRHGIQTLTDTLAARLTHRHVGQPVLGLLRTPEGRYQLQTATASPHTDTVYDAVVLALPTYAAAPLLRPLFAEAAAALDDVQYPPMAAVYTAYQRADVSHPLNGFGALNPKVEQPYAAGSIWTSSIFPGRAPAGQVLFTTFVGGAQYERHARQPEAAQKAAVHEELRRLYGIREGAQPVWQFRYYWERAIPQFDQHIGPAHAAADALQAHNIWSVANWRGGVGVPDCIRQALLVASELTQR
ncbi:protoporphyrinogen oxidase [Hymenobacter sediminicola]|uniref:Coproporphyrinogen III oxidase n=1 Tax=Hymenobacter sediminicola TaxID=2761579 RepID=A0A7G7WAM7_9BACT|nr:protoporphyrinogen oxidase [Hymenobacter sediminicola]QNH63420.1 protoporphyrinogen oxidase [Hymenobacter sediminicola]